MTGYTFILKMSYLVNRIFGKSSVYLQIQWKPVIRISLGVDKNVFISDMVHKRYVLILINRTVSQIMVLTTGMFL